MIQEIFAKTYHNEYRAYAPQPDSRVLYFEKNTVLCRMDGDELTLPRFCDIPGLSEEGTYLFTIGDERFFLIAAQTLAAPEGYEMQSVGIFRTAQPKEAAFAVITGFQLYGWYSASRFCGRCGARTEHDKVERMMRCPECGNMIFPRISPAVIVGVRSGDKLLLTRYNRPGAQRRALIAGFCEIGETVEQTVRREVMEEVGLRVKNLRYYRSQPWSLTGCLLMGFWCEVDGEDTVRVDQSELAEAAWLTREEIDWDDTGISLTGEMTQFFKDGRDA